MCAYLQAWKENNERRAHINALLTASIFTLLNNYVGMLPSDRNRRQIDKSQVARQGNKHGKARAHADTHASQLSILSVVGVRLHHFIAAACYSKIEHRRLTLDGSGKKLLHA